MAPRQSMAQRRQTQSQTEHVYAPGKVGRKTGITIPDNGRRDEHGFEDFENLFSSPDRELLAETNGRAAMSGDEQDEQDMEIDDGSELGPATTRKLQQGSRPSLPRARSPIKTNLNSPARQNPHIQPTSSPTRGDIVTTRERSPRPEVARKLDFSKSQDDSNTMLTNGHTKSKLNGPPGRAKKPAVARPPRRKSATPEPVVPEPESEEDEEPLDLLDAGAVDGGNYDEQPPEEPEQEVEEEEEEEEEEVVAVAKESKATNKAKPAGRRGRKPKPTIEPEQESREEPAPEPVPEPPSANTSTENVEDEEPVKKRKGRPKAAAKAKEPTPPPAEPSPPPPPAKTSKRGRPASTPTEDADEGTSESRGAKRAKTSAKADKAEESAPSKAAPTKEKGKPGRKRKSSGVGVESPQIQRGPPLPRGRGLMIKRREDTNAMKTTRSGRASFKPLQWWSGEHVEYDEDQENLYEDGRKQHFKMPTVKGIVRTEEYEEASAPKRRGRPAAGRKPGKRPSAVAEAEEEVERDDWEYDPGRVSGEVVMWEPEHEFEPPGETDEVHITDEELAVSENAIQLRDIKDATFKFAKTLTLPFFGSGIVDLPPGAEKRPKNSRKNHMVFFVHTGNVRVMVAHTEFAIAKGGMFFVPRGNHYSIKNEADRGARIFFAQGCEMFAQPTEEEE
ncbi:Mif2/CENP-C like-domain-containing protein [Astrocystis sublimbata]|nr:Mif2/CENP-C like-domain-containing protein [Astrocystis sublimbata]